MPKDRTEVTATGNHAAGASKQTLCWKRGGSLVSLQILGRKIIVSLNRELPCACIDSCLSGH
jgi:hypothetical protein